MSNFNTIDDSQIIYLECTNNTKKINLYYYSAIDSWVAYGYSAYSLRLYLKMRGKNCLRGYSSDMMMPCTITDNITVKEIRKELPIVNERAGYICFNREKGFAEADYTDWIEKLQKEADFADILNTQTPVSKYVSKDEYIPDGMSSWERNTKRIVDCFLAFIALVVFSPLILICWIAVRLEDGGPAIYKQERIGRFGRPFNIYKFRSMVLDAENAGPQLSKSCGDGDPRLTKVGRFIRAHHLDELPQLWNVFCGQMAFVGPRPERKFYIDQIMEYDKRYEYLYQIRPGVTSYATIYNGYTDSMEKMLKRLEYDLYYLGHRSWWFDFKILFNTFRMIVLGKKF